MQAIIEFFAWPKDLKKTYKIIGKLQNPITIYACGNNKKIYLEVETEPKKYDTFTEIPVLYTIHGQGSNTFTVNTPTKIISCVLEKELNVINNPCTVRTSAPLVYDDYKSILNYPIEFIMVFTEGQLDGFYDDNGTFHVQKLSVNSD